MDTATNPNIYALLIGINYYFPNRLAGGVSYGHLNGCVADVEGMESFLKTRLGVTEPYIRKLTASHGDGSQPSESAENWPTYDNIIAGLEWLYESADPTDQVLIHYSGHGGQAATIFTPDQKTGNIDEGFVPTDIGTDSGRYLRDLHLRLWLEKLSEKGMTVTAILDCCHSGGMTRGEDDPDAVARGSEDVDTAVRPMESADDVLAMLGEGSRGAAMNMGDTLQSDKWVVLTACRPHELAMEYKFDGENKNGALTYWLLDALNGGGMSLSYRQVHQRLIGRIKSQFARQRPQLYGDGDRAIFGHDRVAATFEANVLSFNEDRNEVTLEAGIIQGIRRKAQLAIFPIGADKSNPEQAIAQITVTDAGASEATARVDEPKEGATIEAGSQAVLLNPGSVKLCGYVRMHTDAEWALSADAQAALTAAHEAANFKKFIEFVENGADFAVGNNDGFYEIWDAAGEVVPRISPALSISDPASADKVIDRLIHLTRYRNVLELANTDSRSSRAPKVSLEWLDVEHDHAFTDGDEANLFIRNDSRSAVEITILMLSEDWSVQQIYPDDGSDSYTFEPNESDTITFDTFLEDDRKEETTIFKVFATVGATNFRMLELPSLDEEYQSKAPTRGELNPLEEILAQLAETTPETRAVRMQNSASRQWTTTQVELVVKA